jgi:hypothetical protein
MSLFLNMEPGDIRVFEQTTPAAVIKAFRSHFKRLGIEAECDFWTLPACRAEDQTVKRLWLIRSDGLSPGAIGEIRHRFIADLPSEFTGVRSFIIDGKELCRNIPPDLLKKRPRTTKHGWELMEVGESKTVRMHTRSLRGFLSLNVMYRRLEWAYECVREYDLEKDIGGSALPYWTVKRIR